MEDKHKTKIIAMYLPQFHEIPENSTFWGEGYTDWVAVKKAKPLFVGHSQPKVPLHEKYYDLSNKHEIQWQANLAASYGIDGFGIYHYWFNSDMCLLKKPAELIRDNKNIGIRYMLCWDNASWRRTWSNVQTGNDWAPLYEKAGNVERYKGILAELDYGQEKDWKIHFDYLLTFFRDDRYLKVGNKPIFCIFNQENNTDILQKMCDYWDGLAIKAGYSGLYYIGRKNNNHISFTEYEFTYEPAWTGWTWRNLIERIRNKLYSVYIYRKSGILLYDYDLIWKKIIKAAERNKSSHLYYGCFVGYDDTPRRGINGKIIINSAPEKFKSYIKELLKICEGQGKEFLFITAWNEWGEGAYLEPDREFEFGYLEALKMAKEELEGSRLQ